MVYSVEKSYVDNLEALKFLYLTLLRTSLEFLIDQTLRKHAYSNILKILSP